MIIFIFKVFSYRFFFTYVVYYSDSTSTTRFFFPLFLSNCNRYNNQTRFLSLLSSFINLLERKVGNLLVFLKKEKELYIFCYKKLAKIIINNKKESRRVCLKGKIIVQIVYTQ